ncbi:MAG: cyclic pyranopterin monophosphate synthase accessory protein [delta proteobacterium ML8_F1]|nr:MAG: cyclic pyranopterin monophosphate synthase accessory protein [delta proteobacterium ML8_F1]
MKEENPLTHFNPDGRARMVSVTDKEDTLRVAVARGSISMGDETIRLVAEGGFKKGDVLGVAQIAGILGAKRTSDLIPMCHPLMLTSVDLSFEIDGNRILMESRVALKGRTGVEMEALTAVGIAGLTIYDMCKAVDKDMVIGEIRLVYKTGGKSGTYQRQGEVINSL